MFPALSLTWPDCFLLCGDREKVYFLLPHRSSSLATQDYSALGEGVVYVHTIHPFALSLYLLCMPVLYTISWAVTLVIVRSQTYGHWAVSCMNWCHWEKHLRLMWVDTNHLHMCVCVIVTIVTVHSYIGSLCCISDYKLQLSKYLTIKHILYT